MACVGRRTFPIAGAVNLSKRGRSLTAFVSGHKYRMETLSRLSMAVRLFSQLGARENAVQNAVIVLIEIGASKKRVCF